MAKLTVTESLPMVYSGLLVMKPGEYGLDSQVVLKTGDEKYDGWTAWGREKEIKENSGRGHEESLGSGYLKDISPGFSFAVN